MSERGVRKIVKGVTVGVVTLIGLITLVPISLALWVQLARWITRGLPLELSEWESSLGNFLGSIIGFLGILVTLYFSKKENDRIIQETKKENDRIIRATKDENDKMIKENHKLATLELMRSDQENMSNRLVAEKERQLMIEENKRMLRHQIRPYFLYYYTLNEFDSNPSDTILLINQSISVNRTEIRYFDFLSLKNVGIHTAGNVCVHRYKLKVIDEYKKELNLSIDRLLHDKLQNFHIIEKEDVKKIILPFGNHSDEYKSTSYELELIIKYEDVSGYVYYDRVLIKNNKAECIKRYEGNPLFNTDDYKILD